MAKINGTVNALEVEENNDEGDDTVTGKHRYTPYLLLDTPTSLSQ